MSRMKKFHLWRMIQAQRFDLWWFGHAARLLARMGDRRFLPELERQKRTFAMMRRLYDAT